MDNRKGKFREENRKRERGIKIILLKDRVQIFSENKSDRNVITYDPDPVFSPKMLSDIKQNK